MDKQAFPTLDQDRWMIKAVDIKDQVDGLPNSAEFNSPPDSSAATHADCDTPISSKMQEDAQTVDAEDTIEKAEEILSSRGFIAAPVLGSN